MKKIGTILVILFFHHLCFAQVNTKIEIVKSDVVELDKKWESYPPFYFGDKGVLEVCSDKKYEYKFQLFGNNLKLIKENTVNLANTLKENVGATFLIQLGSKTYLLAKYSDRKLNVEKFTYVEFDIDKLNFLSEEKLLYEGKNSGGAGFCSEFYEQSFFANYQPFEFCDSKNKKVLLFPYLIKQERVKKEQLYEKIGYHAFDQNLNKIWEKVLTMPYPKSKINRMDFLVTDDSHICILAKVKEDNANSDERDKSKPNYHLELFSYSMNDTLPNITQIALDSIEIREGFVIEKENSRVSVFGLYSSRPRKPIDGFFALDIDNQVKNVNIHESHFVEIPDELIKSNRSQHALNRLDNKAEKDPDNDLGIEGNFIVQSIQLINNDRIMLALENYDISFSTTQTMRGTRDYNYSTMAEEVYVFSVSGNGNGWVRKIPKKQMGFDNYGSGISFKSLVVDNDIYFFYVDNRKNMDLQTNETPHEHWQKFGGYLMCSSFDENGNHKKQLIEELGTVNDSFYIRRGVLGRNCILVNQISNGKTNTLISVNVKK